MSQNSEKAAAGSQTVLHVLRKRIVRDLRSGVLEHGDRLPSVREVGEELGVDPRVVLVAYQQLVEEGIVEIRSRSGVFAVGAYTPRGNAVSLPRRWMLETILGAIARDIPPLWLVEQLRSALVTRRVRAALIECNTDQLDSMREELTTYFGMDVVTIPLGVAAAAVYSRELTGIDLVISAAHEEIVARIAGTMQKPYVITSVRPALVSRLSRLLARGPFYLLIVDPIFGTKMRRLVAPMAWSENFHVLVVDHDDLRVIPAGAPTYVMRSAQSRLAGKRHLGREIPPQRIFSEKSSREILARVLELSSDVAGDRSALEGGPVLAPRARD